MRNQESLIVIAIVVAGAFAANVQAAVSPSSGSTKESGRTKKAELEQATFGLGCYSCAEAIFERLKGVTSVAVGYSGVL
jgi:hypothetical protein